MRDDGPEPIIVQIKESLRASDDLDNQLAEFASLRQESRVSLTKWWGGRKLLAMLSFPRNFTEEEALVVIARLQQSPAVEKVVAQSAFNLEFHSADFERAYEPSEAIPDAARRGFDVERLSRRKIKYSSSSTFGPHIPNRLIVRWKDEYVWKAGATGFRQRFADFNRQADCTVVEEQNYSDHDLTQVLEFDASRYSVADQLAFYQASEWVDYVQPNFIYQTQAEPNDPIYAAGRQWSLAKVSAPAAWNLTTGSDSVVVAVVDTGATVGHPDFVPNRWSGQNNGEIHDFALDRTSVSTITTHGSNVASIVGAQGNNGAYLTGLSWNVSLMHLKVFDDDAFGSTSATVKRGIDYAVTNRAVAINLSLGGNAERCEMDGTQRICDYFLDETLASAVRNAPDRNVVAVCGAGNGLNNDGVGINTDSDKPFSPAATPTDNVIAVAASDQNDVRPGFSNYGPRKNDLAAPGVSIYGLKPTYNANSNDLNNYSVLTGTSQATPHVTGTVALLKARYPWENYFGLRDRVLMGTDDLPPAFAPLVRTGGRLNVNKALHPRTVIRNLSTRARVESGDRIMIGGFTVGGSGAGTLKIAIRGLGPSLPNLGVAKLNNPTIQLNNSAGQPIYSNSDWGTLPPGQKSELNLAGLNPTDDREAAMVQTLGPGSYTLFLQSQDGAFGVGLFEIYELQGGTNEQTRLRNVSTRCLVRTNNEQAVAGVIVGDPAQGTNPAIPDRSLLMLGKGPSLPTTIPGRLANPYLALYNSAGALMGSNDSWSNLAAPTDELVEAKFNPSSSAESALWPILKSGSYTTILSGVSGGTGIGIIEMYER